MPDAADPELFGADQIHPNAKGHGLMATVFADLLLAGSTIPGGG
jgi:lysophospholipase L1-like esterase